MPLKQRLMSMFGKGAPAKPAPTPSQEEMYILPYEEGSADPLLTKRNNEVDFMNRPENIDAINQHMAHFAQQKYGKPLAELDDDEWGNAANYGEHQVLSNMYKLAQSIDPNDRHFAASIAEGLVPTTQEESKQEILRQLLAKPPHPKDDRSMVPVGAIGGGMAGTALGVPLSMAGKALGIPRANLIAPASAVAGTVAGGLMGRRADMRKRGPEGESIYQSRLEGQKRRAAQEDLMRQLAGEMSGQYHSYLPKNASVAQLSTIADLAQSGALGDDVQAAFEGMTAGINSYVEEEITEKTASASDFDYNIYDENAARIARLDNLLRKR